ncbi:hypothetical protein KVT40_004735 [Elsinoe batatas]|uniref:Uncharacterized protein n=1 Tax=Elsinoe batatas TaxID=2601811 RepID=A0A8K0L1A9_9PEZI|nr:hypothetical protein KVT40_004735 [Elsinoe batatas]
MLALVTVSDRGDTKYISMHPLAHAWARDRQSETRKTASWRAAVSLILLAHVKEAFWFCEAELMVSHVLALIDCRSCGDLPSMTRDAWLRLNAALALCVEAVGTPDQVVTFLQQTVAEMGIRSHFDEIHEPLARTLLASGRTEDAMAIWSRSKPPVHVESRGPAYLALLDRQRLRLDLVVLKAMSLIASVATDVGVQIRLSRGKLMLHDDQAERAQKLLEDTLQQMKKIRQPKDALMLRCQVDLADAYIQTKIPGKAVLLLQHVLQVQQQLFGEDNAACINTQCQLAKAYAASDDPITALRLFEKTLAQVQQFYASKHPQRLVIECACARAFIDDDRPEAALILMDRICEITDESYVDTHGLRIAADILRGRALVMAEGGNAGLELFNSGLERARTSLPKRSKYRMLAEKWASQKDMVIRQQIDGRFDIAN